MIVQSVRVRHFRSILDESLTCDQLTALVGANGSGKSSFLRAMELFYTPEPKVTTEDFYSDDTSREIEVTVTFGDLSQAAAQKFGKYIENGTLTISRMFAMTGGSPSAKYHGSTLQNPDFVAVRGAGGKSEVRARFGELREQPAYADLPAARSADGAEAAMSEWEVQHGDRCVRTRDDGQFFGFKQVAQGYLGEFTRFIFVPAVRDAADDAAEGKGSVISELMDLVVRSALAAREDLTRFRQDVQTQYETIVDPDRLTELQELGGRLTTTLRSYVPDAGVDLAWLKIGAIDIPMPKAQCKLVEDGFCATVARTGHGLQRAFILTLLQHLAVARSASPGEPPQPGADAPSARALPNLVLAIEEPELYQHPNRQRHISKILLQLATGTIPGVAGRTQIVYGTHSPLFVGTDRFDQIRLTRKVDADAGRPRKTRLIWTTLANIAAQLWELNGQQGPQYTADSLRARLQSIMTPWMNEGFFADVAVLVEGEDDRAAILGVAASKGHDLEADGIAVIPCMGKTNLDRPLLIFRKLGIETYPIWDSDRGGEEPKPEVNRLLLKIVGEAEEDFPARVTTSFASFERNLEETLRTELTAEVFTDLLTRVGNELGITKRRQTIKNPAALRAVIDRARTAGHSSPTLENIVDRIIALRNRVMRAEVGGAA